MVNPTIGMIVKHKAAVTVTLQDGRKMFGIIRQANPGFVTIQDEADKVFIIPLLTMKGIAIDEEEVKRLEEIPDKYAKKVD